MQLAPVPDRYESTIVIGTSIRKRAEVLKPYLDSLAWQELPERTKVHYVFVADGLDTAAMGILNTFLSTHSGEVLRGVPGAVGDFSDQHSVTHQWSPSAMRRVGDNKNRILRRGLELRADAVWLADADLICDRTTLKSLAATDRPIACAVYWTHWQRQTQETRAPQALPQVWLRHPYQLDGRGMDQAEFWRRLLSRSLTRVWGQGACTLIRRPVIEAGVDFSYLPDVPTTGMMAGEDRHFCIKAERLHIEMWADCWSDIFHIYRTPEDVARVPDMVARLGTEHPKKAGLGDLVSLKIQALEPMPMPNNQWSQIPPQHLRGRLGQLTLLPELEEAVWSMERDQEQIIPVHIPTDYPIAYLRGRRRLMRVRLVDCKPFGASPVIEDELHVVPLSRRYQDRVTLTPQQREAIHA